MKLKIIVYAILFILIVLAVAAVYVGVYRNPAHRQLEEAGIVQKQAQVGTVTFNYAEGPDNGPALLIQADTSYMEDGTLNGAMSEEMAMRAMSCLTNGNYVRLAASHVTNPEAPDEFARLLISFFLGNDTGA